MKKQFIILSLLASLAFGSQAFAHAGHDEAPGSDSAGVASNVALSDAAINNLGIETVKAVISPRAATVDVGGVVEIPPERQAIINSSAAGRVSEIHIKVGEKIGKGQKLLTIQPIFVGSSPVAIMSPISGYVTKQSVVIGQSVTPESALMEVSDPSEVLVRGIMYETPDVSKIQVGQKVYVSSALLGSQPLTGTVQRLDGAFDSGSRTFNLYALVPNPERRLLANMQVRLAVETASPADVLTVPFKAVLGDSGEQFVFVRNGNEFERRIVKLGVRYGNEVEVLEGVFPDEDVVTVGNYQLQFAKPADAKPKETQDDGHGHAH